MSIVGVGVDIERVARFDPIEEHQKLIDRLFTEGERSYCDMQARPASNFAARFAAKEAAVKALCSTLPGLLITNVEVYKDAPSAQPLLRLISGKVLPPGVRLHLSISHTDEHAIAYVIAEYVSD